MARVAFAEVTSFAQYLEEKQGGTLAKMLISFKTKPSVDEALREVTGLSLTEWDKEWRGDLARKSIANVMPKPSMSGPRDRDAFRIAELALQEGHATLALRHLSRLATQPAKNPSPFTRAMSAAALLDVSDKEGARKALADTGLEAACSAFWTARARLSKIDGKPVAADLSQAIALDPYARSATCGIGADGEGKDGTLCTMAVESGTRSSGLATTD